MVLCSWMEPASETSDLAGLERETLRGWEFRHCESVTEEGEGIVIGRENTIL